MKLPGDRIHCGYMVTRVSHCNRRFNEVLIEHFIYFQTTFLDTPQKGIKHVF